MLRREQMIPGNRRTYPIAIDNDLISSEWVREIFSLPVKGSGKSSERYCYSTLKIK